MDSHAGQHQLKTAIELRGKDPSENLRCEHTVTTLFFDKVILFGRLNGAEGGIRTPTGRPTRPSSVRVYQFHHFGTQIK